MLYLRAGGDGGSIGSVVGVAADGVVATKGGGVGGCEMMKHGLLKSLPLLDVATEGRAKGIGCGGRSQRNMDVAAGAKGIWMFKENME